MSWSLSALPTRLICLGASFFKFLLISWLCQLLSKLEGGNQTPGLGAPTMVSSPLTCPFARPCNNPGWTVVNIVRSEFGAALVVLFCHPFGLTLSLEKKKEPFTWASMSLLFLSELLQAQSYCSAINCCRILVEHLGTYVGNVFQLLQKLEWLRWHPGGCRSSSLEGEGGEPALL